MALTYEKVIGVISQAPANRKDFEVTNLLPWFRKKSDLFRNLKQELLFDLIKNLHFVNKKRDDLVIRQGDYGDCMYILLRGQVTIYMMYAKKLEDDTGEGEKKKVAPEPLNIAGGENIRSQLGTFVTNLGPGATFGEIALLKDEDCERTASIIANDSIDLIEIDRDLYNRSVKNVLKQEFEDKANFIANNPFFQNWAPKYKKQLAMALQIEVFPYDSIMTKQGEPVAAIYFILRGEVKVVVDPQQHKQQYPKYYEHHDDFLPPKSGSPDINEEHKNERLDYLLQDMSSHSRERSFSDPSSFSKFRKKVQKKQHLEVCLLGVNECIGDIEVLMDMDTSLQTAKCTQRTEVLVLEMKHYERLLVKRNPRTIKVMKECLDLRLKSRMNKHDDQVPLFKSLYDAVLNFTAMSLEQSQARHGGKGVKTDPVKHRRTVEEYFKSFIPPAGALIDMYGPGTVFYRIREREKQRMIKKKGKKVYATPGYTSPRSARNGMDPHHLQRGHTNMDMYGTSQQVDPMTSDPALKDLEERMRHWLQWDGSKAQPRVSRLHRSQVEEENLKPGAKVVFRPKGSMDSPRVNHDGQLSDGREDSDDDNVIMHGNSWGSGSSQHTGRGSSYQYYNGK